MAKVTRNVSVTKIEALVVNVETKEVVTVTRQALGKLRDSKSLQKKIKASVEAEGLRFLEITNFTYGKLKVSMPVEQFVELGTIEE